MVCYLWCWWGLVARWGLGLVFGFSLLVDYGGICCFLLAGLWFVVMICFRWWLVG